MKSLLLLFLAALTASSFSQTQKQSDFYTIEPIPLPPGEVMEIGIDNQSSMEILPTMVGGFGARHLGTVRAGNVWKVYIQKGV